MIEEQMRGMLSNQGMERTRRRTRQALPHSRLQSMRVEHNTWQPQCAADRVMVHHAEGVYGTLCGPIPPLLARNDDARKSAPCKLDEQVLA